MTFWAKLLTVIILVMSVFFAAASAILFAKRTEWRQSFDTLQQTAGGQIEQLNSTLKQTDTALQTTKADRDQIRSERDDFKLRNAAQADQINQMNVTIAEKTKMLDADDAQIKYFTEENKKAEDRYNAIRDEKEKLVAEASDLRTKLTDQQGENHRLSEQNAALADDLQKTKESLASANEALKTREEWIAHLYNVFPNMRTQIESLAKLEPRINGKVVAVDDASGIVIINIGMKAGIKKEFGFTVYRDGDFKGMIRIFDLTGDSLAAGHVETLAKDAQGNSKKIEIGDDVATTIGY